MTCVVAVRGPRGVMLGADSCAGSGHHAFAVLNPRKVLRIGEFAIGYTTSFRMGELLGFALRALPRDTSDDLLSHLVNVFVPQVRHVLRDGGFLKKVDEQESGGTFLLAHGSRLFTVQDDFSVLEPQAEFAAVGCGEEWATGALFALRRTRGSPAQKLRTALEAAAAHSAYVRPPFHFVRTQRAG